MASRARLDLGFQIVCLSDRHSCWGVSRGEVAQQADGVDLGAIEEVRILSAVRKVASGAAFGLHYGMFIQKGPADFRVALRADDVLLRGRQLKIISNSAAWFMTISAQDYPLFHLMTGGHGECGPLVIMALQTDLRL